MEVRDGLADDVGRSRLGSRAHTPVGLQCAGEVIATGDDVVLVSERTGDAMDALGGGRLETVGGCLGADGVVIVWPHGTDVVGDDALTVDIPDYGTFTVGDEVRVGGGYVVEHSSDNIEPGPYEVAGVTVPAACAKHDIFLAH